MRSTLTSKNLLITLCLILISPACCWALETCDLLANGMVLQQQSSVRIWGKSLVGRTIRMKVSWSNDEYSSTTDKNGNWLLTVKTPVASFKEQQMTLSDGLATKKIISILIGEVWLCSGQSNMEMSFKGYPNQPIAGAKGVLEKVKNNQSLRVFKLSRKICYQASDSLKGKWLYGNPDDIANCSALAYLFGRNIHEKLDVPVGIIQAAWDGSSIEGWLTEDLVARYSDYNPQELLKGRLNFMKPFIMYNGMINPLRNCTFRGCIWYQGESNVTRVETYLSKMKDMIGLWRNTFRDSNLPFFIVEITPYALHPSIESAKLREAQYLASQSIEKCYLISTNDLVDSSEANILHPSNKSSIADRLSNSVLHHIHGKTTICATFPRFSSLSLEKDATLLSFINCEGELFKDTEKPDKGLRGFEIAGEDKHFYPAEAFFKGENKQILVYAKEVPRPIAVRYCFKAYQKGNVRNSCGLPLIPFRTDNWSQNN